MLNDTLELNLKKPTLNQIITRLQELLRKPVTEKIIEVSRGENLATIIQLDCQMLQSILPQISKSEIKTLERVPNYTALANARQEILINYLSQNQNELKNIDQNNKRLIN